MFSCKTNLDINLRKGKISPNPRKIHTNFSKQNNGPAPTLVDLANGGTASSVAPPQPAPTPAPPSVNQSQIQPLTGIQFNVTDFKPSKTSRQLCEENGIRFDHNFSKNLPVLGAQN